MGSKTSIAWCCATPTAWRCSARPSAWRGKSVPTGQALASRNARNSALSATKHVAVELDEFIVPIGHHRIAPVDDPGEAAILDEHVVGCRVAVDEDAVDRLEPGEVVVDLRDQMRRQ